jgi:hypothetical protein
VSKLLLTHEPGVRQYLHKHAHDPSKIALQTEYDAEPVLSHVDYLRARTEAVSRTKRRIPGCKVLGVVPRAMYFDPHRKMWQWSEAEWRKFWADPDNRMLVVESDQVRR